MIAYDMAPERVVTCAHLQPLERAMRKAGVRVQLQNGVHEGAHCLIDLDALGRVHGAGAAAMYEERHEIDRSVLDPKSALFWCDACQGSRLIVLHPEQAAPDTPWFPARPTGPAHLR